MSEEPHSSRSGESLQLKLSSNQLRCSLHTTYYANFFVLRLAVRINGQLAEIGYSKNEVLCLRCRYPTAHCMDITYHTIASELEAVLKKYRVSHVSSFWCEEDLFIQVGFSAERNLRMFLGSQKEVRGEICALLSAFLQGRQGPVSSAVSNGFPVEVLTELFLVLPDADDKIREVTMETCADCMTVLKGSEKFDFGALFRAHKLKCKGNANGTELLTVKSVVSELSCVVDWFHLGLYLNVPVHELQTIKADNGQTKDCRSTMLIQWMKQSKQATWAAVVTALLKIGMRGLAETIALKYNVSLPRSADCEVIERLPLSLQVDDHPMLATVEKLRAENVSRSETLVQVCKALKKEQKLNVTAKTELAKSRAALLSAEDIVTCLIEKQMKLEEDVAMKEKELRYFRKALVVMKDKDLSDIIEKKEAEIAQLKCELTVVESELGLAQEETRRLKEMLHQTNIELAAKIAEVHMMKKMQADMERERKRMDMMLAAMIANQSAITTVTSSAKISALKRGIGEWEEKQARLLAQWEDKQAENQMLLRDRERQSQHEGEQEERLGLLAADISELQGRLLAAEDGKMQAEVALQSIVCQISHRPRMLPQSRTSGVRSVHGDTVPPIQPQGDIPHSPPSTQTQSTMYDIPHPFLHSHSQSAITPVPSSVTKDCSFDSNSGCDSTPSSSPSSFLCSQESLPVRLDRHPSIRRKRGTPHNFEHHGSSSGSCSDNELLPDKSDYVTDQSSQVNECSSLSPPDYIPSLHGSQQQVGRNDSNTENFACDTAPHSTLTYSRYNTPRQQYLPLATRHRPSEHSHSPDSSLHCSPGTYFQPQPRLRREDYVMMRPAKLSSHPPTFSEVQQPLVPGPVLYPTTTSSGSSTMMPRSRQNYDVVPPARQVYPAERTAGAARQPISQRRHRRTSNYENYPLPPQVMNTEPVVYRPMYDNVSMAQQSRMGSQICDHYDNVTRTGEQIPTPSRTLPLHHAQFSSDDKEDVRLPLKAKSMTVGRYQAK